MFVFISMDVSISMIEIGATEKVNNRNASEIRLIEAWPMKCTD